MKIAKIILVFKKDDKHGCNNYRPISLLPNVSKIYKKCVPHRLTLLLENKKFLKFQFGFSKNHSTKHALISLVEQICNALDNNRFACGVFIDLQKVFYTVNHKIFYPNWNIVVLVVFLCHAFKVN